ncbi:MAG: N-6 DNA methylase [Desulfamplus sp.]
MTKKELEDYLWGAANILRGMIDAADFKQYIFPLLFFKRVSDVWYEEYQTALSESGNDFDYAGFRENHRFQIPDGCHWEDVRKRTVDVGSALQEALNGIEKANLEMLHDVFGDAQWTNKRRMSDEKMLDLIEHFSQMDLTVSNVPHDIMGQGYEYLIKKFADDSGHTAAEFYTNRTVVKLMTQITNPQSGESIYDPTCGSGGILLSSVLHLKEQGKEYRNLKLFGQELNLITSAIARINMFMHNVDEFVIVQGDTLEKPQILENDELRKFDVIMANPPYSVKRWNQKKWMNDPFGRNIWGTPPQGCADYAFQQHIMKSLNPETGRSVVLWPHGVLFRDAEGEIRRKMVEEDYVDAVIGLGKNLFYNSSMESCLLVCRMKKPQERQSKILFIDAKEELKIERTNAWLEPHHIKKIADAYWQFKDVEGFAKVMSNKDVLENNGNLSLQLYVKQVNSNIEHNTLDLIANIKAGQQQINNSLENLFTQLKNIGIGYDQGNIKDK